jgi:hypothetical protein
MKATLLRFSAFLTCWEALGATGAVTRTATVSVIETSDHGLSAHGHGHEHAVRGGVIQSVCCTSIDLTLRHLTRSQRSGLASAQSTGRAQSSRGHLRAVDGDSVRHRSASRWYRSGCVGAASQSARRGVPDESERPRDPPAGHGGESLSTVGGCAGRQVRSRTIRSSPQPPADSVRMSDGRSPVRLAGVAVTHLARQRCGAQPELWA